ncbi:MAG: pilus assembly protein TadG-related protein [Acidimicrobiia bacterium]|nr:pilus assembly protein TadG-related protein [Acidimicrobiia bacterium]
MVVAAGDRGGERGWVTLWVLGLCVMVLFLGGVSLDLWRVLAERRELAATADAAARAGTGAIDEAAWRTGELRLDPAEAEALALDHLAAASAGGPAVDGRVGADDTTVTVELEREVELTLTRVLAGEGTITVRVRADARPLERG